MTTTPRLATLAALVTVLAGILAGPAARIASASDQQQSIMMDDDRLVYRDDATRDAALKRMKALGVDTVRVTLLWSVVADGARHGKARDRRFRKLGADNPKAYPVRNWDRYDRLVRACKTLGLGLYFDVTGPGPSWGHERAPRSQRRNRRTWKPKPGQFAAFVRAVGKRYSGTYKDEDDGHPVIPRVTAWALWNEPNQGGWLTPQWSGGKPASPALYRKLFIAGRRALVETGHGKDTILIGETAPMGSSQRTARSPMRPAEFIRDLFCVTRSGAKANGPGCSAFDDAGPLQATAWAHHPYTKDVAPTVRDKNPDSITMANLNDLPTLLDQIAQRTGRVNAGMPVVLTEFGFETNPPDRFSGVPIDKQAQWINDGDYLAYLNPRVIGQTQFLLYDAAPVTRHKPNTKAYWFTYQSGLFFADGRAKPSAIAYMLPFEAFDAGPGVANVWGQLRFRPDGLPPSALDSVQLQFKPAGSAAWAPLGDPIVVSNAKGFFAGQVALPGPGALRAAWSDPASGGSVVSREVPVG